MSHTHTKSDWDAAKATHGHLAAGVAACQVALAKGQTPAAREDGFIKQAIANLTQMHASGATFAQMIDGLQHIVANKAVIEDAIQHGLPIA